MDDTTLVNFDYDSNKEPPSLIDTFRRIQEQMIKHAKDEEEKMKSPDWEYRRTHIASREVFELMTNPDTPLEIRMQLEWATFAGYQWVHKDEANIYVDDKI
jgi:hypothetical protein